MTKSIVLERLLELICFDPATCKRPDGSWKPIREFTPGEARCIASIEFTTDASGARSITDITFHSADEAKAVARQLLFQDAAEVDNDLAELWGKLRQLSLIGGTDDKRG